MMSPTRSTSCSAGRAGTPSGQCGRPASVRRRRRFGLRIWVGLVACWCAFPAFGEIIGDIVRVGYLATSGAVVRTGAWTPVLVDLSLENQSSFDGLLRLRQFDRDGDVYVDSVPVHLFADGGARKRYWLYTVVNPVRSRKHGFAVELLETQDGDEATAALVKVISGGRPVAMLIPPLDPQVVPDDHYLILSVSDGPLGAIRHLLDPEVVDTFDRTVSIAHVAPGALPSQWIGLEMIDGIVWDEADPTQLTEAQEQALVEWVRQGGTLVLAAGRTSDAVGQAKFLGPLLPVKVGSVRATANLPQVRHRLLGIIQDQKTDAGYKKPVVIASCEVIDAPDVTRLLYDEALGATVVAARRVGRGRLVFVSAALGNLLDDSQAAPVGFFKKLLELRRNPIAGRTPRAIISPCSPTSIGRWAFTPRAAPGWPWPSSSPSPTSWPLLWACGSFCWRATCFGTVGRCWR